MRIGVFGGSFNPPHIGHLVVAESARIQLQLDKVLWIPNNAPPHKTLDEGASNLNRKRMVSLAIESNPEFELSEIELDREGVSYMFETLELLHKEFPDDELWLIIGMDSLASLHRWREPARIVALARLAVYPRIGYSLSDADELYRQLAVVVDAPILDVSSTRLREELRGQRTVRYLIPDPVNEYIVMQRLYNAKARPS
jgi:nicotinate-nucleotide adenylyltransferase